MKSPQKGQPSAFEPSSPSAAANKKKTLAGYGGLAGIGGFPSSTSNNHNVLSWGSSRDVLGGSSGAGGPAAAAFGALASSLI